MKKLLLSLVLLPALFLLSLPGAGVLPAVALGGAGQGLNVAEGHYRNPPVHNSAAPKGPQVQQLQTIPPTPGVTFQIAGQQFVTGADGSTVVVVPQPGTYDLQVITDTYHDPYRRVEFSRWLSESFQPTRQIHIPSQSNQTIQVGLDVYELVGQKFVELNGAPVPLQRISEFTIRSLQGDIFTFHDGQPRWIPASRVTRRRDGGLDVVPLLYTVTSVMVDGSNVVNKAQQQFYAKPNGTWTITLLFYSIQVQARDALFGFPVGKAVNLELPNGQIQSVPLDSTGTARASSLARGQYYFQVTGAKGFSPRSPVALSKDQSITARVISFIDMGAVFAAGMLIAIALLVFGKVSLRRAEARHDAERRVRILRTD